MRDFAQRPAHERAEVFEETAARLGLGQAMIVEKDFWVCWTLDQLFGADGLHTVVGHPSPLVFKGGTSLSKVFGVLDRFSEDIDLVLDRSVVAPNLPDPSQRDVSGKQRKRRIDAAVSAFEQFAVDRLLPFIQARCALLDGAQCVIDGNDAQTLLLQYPRALINTGYQSESYVRPVVRLEFGIRGSLTPATAAPVRPFAAEQFPELFGQPACTVLALRPERTFWEKATILHEVAHRGKVAGGERQSRHYADLVALYRSAFGPVALRDDALLQDVADHKTQFFPRPEARYDLARRGTLRLLPPPDLSRLLEQDYRKMETMYFGNPIPWREVLEDLEQVERTFNGADNAGRPHLVAT